VRDIINYLAGVSWVEGEAYDMKKTTERTIIIVTMLCLLIGIVVGASRNQVEKKRRNFQVAIKYSDVVAISNGTGESLEEVLIKFKDAGANTLFVRENTVIPESSSDVLNYKAQGKATYYSGYELQNIYSNANNVKPQDIYIQALDQQTEEQIYNHFMNKDIRVNVIDIQDKSFLEIQEAPYILSTIGVGFNMEDLTSAAHLGYTIAPQIKSWSVPSEESIMYVVNQLEQIPNLGAIYFSDPEVVGLESPDMEQILHEKGLGFVEFFSDKQKEFTTLAKASSHNGTDYNLTRLHTLADGEANTYTRQALLERYMLALRERNMSAFLFKLPTKEGITIGEQELIEQIQEFIVEADKKGYTPSNDVGKYNLKRLNYWSILFIGIAALGVFVLLCEQLGLFKIGVVMSILGFLGYAALLKLNLGLGAKMMALFGTICFPTYAIVRGIGLPGKGMWHAIKSLFTTVFISFGGALIVVGTISSTELGLGIELFRGVKISFLAPLVLVLIIIIYKNHDFDLRVIEKWIKKPITYGTTAILAILALVMLIYVIKSGNSGQAIDLEIQIRQLLTNVLGVRPRTKEFLIGYPLLMIITYYGYKKFHWPLLIIAAMGPISLVNTYTHIHTPIMISLIRSLYGVVIGMVIGIIAIYIIEYIINSIKLRLNKASV